MPALTILTSEIDRSGGDAWRADGIQRKTPRASAISHFSPAQHEVRACRPAWTGKWSELVSTVTN